MKLLKSLIKISGFSLFIVFILGLTSCKDQGMCESDFKKYVEQKENGLIHQKQFEEDLKISCVYKPANLLFKHDTAFLRSNEADFYWFSFTIEYKGTNSIDFTKFSAALSQQAIESYLWFTIEVDNKEEMLSSVQPISYLGAADKMSYLLTISKEILKNNEFTIHFNPSDKRLKFLASDFQFKLHDLKKIPQIKLAC